MADTYETVEADAGSGGAKFAQQEYTIGADDVVFPVTLLGMFIDESTPPILLRGTEADGALVNLGANNDVTVTSGTVTANAGTNLNTSLLALESGGNLAGCATSLAAIDDWDESDRCKVNLIVGQAGVAAGAGAVGATVQRMTLASDDPAVALLTTIDTDTSALAGCVAGTEVQVDIVGALPAGTNAIGKLAANNGVDIGDVDVTSIVPGTGATNLGKAIDTATGATDTGVLSLATRDDALSSLTPAEGDNVQLRVDANGALWCIVSGTVTVGSHAVTNAGTFVVQENGAALTALQVIDDWDESDRAKVNLVVGQAGITAGAGSVAANTPRMTLASDDPAVALLGTIDADTGGIVTAVQLLDDCVYVDDADWTDDTSKHLLVGGVYQSSPHTVTDGDVTPFLTDVNGRQVVVVSGTVTVGSHAVTNAGTFAVQVDGAALTALQLLDDVIKTDDAGFTPATDKVAMIGFEADETATDSVDEGDAGAARMTLDRKQIVTQYAHTTGGTTPYSALSTAAVIAAEIKGSPGQVFGVHVFNNGANEVFLRLYNMTGTPGTGDTPVYRAIVPGDAAGAGFIFNLPVGIAFGTGIGIRVTAAVADNDSTSLSANEVMVNVLYK